MIDSTSGYTVGVGAIEKRSGSFAFYIEYAAQICPEKSHFNSKHLSRIAAVIDGLEALGYGLNCEGGTVTCEKEVLQKELEEEYEKLQKIIEKSKKVDI